MMERVVGGQTSYMFPPGTVYLKSEESDQVLRSPQPSSDPNDPLNWPTRRKVLHITLLSFYTLMIFASNSVSIPLYSDMRKEMNYSSFILDASYAANSATLAIACIIFVPFAIVYGRRIVYIITSLIVLASVLWSAQTQTAGEVIGSSILQGFAGSVNESLFQLTVTDMIFVNRRGTVSGIYVVMATTGNYMGPVISGYIAKAEGWRWSFWWTAVLLGIVCVLLIFLLEESKYERIKLTTTSTHVLEEPFAEVETSPGPDNEKNGSVQIEEKKTTNAFKINHDIPMRTYAQRHSLLGSATKCTKRQFLRIFYEPAIILWYFPAILLGACQYGFYISTINILALTQSTIYPREPYNFSTTGVGNMNVSPAIGAILGSAYGGPLVDKAVVYFAKRNGGIYEPEMRLRLIGLPAIVLTAGTLLYGLTVAKGMAWPINSVGAGMMGFGLGGAGDILITYLQDAYTKIIGPAFVGAAFIVNIFGTILLFAIWPWEAGMGTFNMFVLLGCISFVFNLMAIPMLIWGKAWRRQCSNRYEDLAQSQLGR